MTVKIQIRRDNSAVWKTLNPVLSAGEQGLELDTGRTKFGDGVTPWNGRPYAYGSSPEDTNKTVWGDIIGTLAAQEDLKTILDSKIGRAEKGEAGGVAPLDGTGVIPSQFVVIPPAFPSGGIIMWSGAINTIPIGWALCDGENGTPNLLDRFITSVATASSNPGDTGGANAMSLSLDNIPAHDHAIGAHDHTMKHSHTSPTHTHGIGSHTHTIKEHKHFVRLTADSVGDHTHGIPSGATYTDKGRNTGSNSGIEYARSEHAGSAVRPAGAHTHPVTGDTGETKLATRDASPPCSSTATTINAHEGNTGSVKLSCSVVGSGAAFDNRPAFFALAFIMKL